MAYAFVASVRNSPGTNGNTSSSIDTSGADLLVGSTSSYEGGPDPSRSDSKGNTWTPLTVEEDAVNTERVQLFYAENPTVGSGHTFTVGGNGIFHVSITAAFSGAATASVFDAESAGALITTDDEIFPGNLTPANDNSLFVTAIATLDTGGVAFTVVTASYTTIHNTLFSSGSNYGGGMAYHIQGTAAVQNPKWDWGGGAGCAAAAVMACFKDFAAGGGATGHPAMKRFGGVKYAMTRGNGVW